MPESKQNNSSRKYKIDNLTYQKKIKYMLIMILLFFAVLELGLRGLYFQFKARSPLAIITTIRTAHTYYKRKIDQAKLQKMNLPPNTFDALWTEKGAKVLSSFSEIYEGHFKTLVNEATAIGSKVIVLYH